MRDILQNYLFFLLLKECESFCLRCLNTLATIGICAAVSLYVRPQTETIISNYFPGEEIPSLEELSSNIALHINHGSPFLGDGLRLTWIKF